MIQPTQAIRIVQTPHPMADSKRVQQDNRFCGSHYARGVHNVSGGGGRAPGTSGSSPSAAVNGRQEPAEGRARADRARQRFAP